MQNIIRSRTIWSIVALFIIGGTGAVDSFIPEAVKPAVAAVVGLLGIYFRVNTKVPF